MGSDRFSEFSTALATEVLRASSVLRADPDNPCRVRVRKENGELAPLDLTPFEAAPQDATAASLFEGVGSFGELYVAYQNALAAAPFEGDLPGACAGVHDFARRFLDELFEQAAATLQDRDAVRIAQWVKHFDLYVAVKAVESLLNSKADLALLEMAEEKGWEVHFDHLAIRCGSSRNRDAERVVAMLRDPHGYVPSQVRGEDFYRFDDGWNAYLLYKVLDNGQFLRLFIDQSDADHPEQIIQHWNHVYGYTAHHLAIRATYRTAQGRAAVPLEWMTEALAQRGIGIMTPTGHYTDGLLLQVFTRPERTVSIPAEIKLRLAAYSADRAIDNGKLLELVSRREMPEAFAERLFRLYGLDYDPGNPLHSAPVYPYFLPEQAAHVIKTSVEIEG